MIFKYLRRSHMCVLKNQMYTQPVIWMSFENKFVLNSQIFTQKKMFTRVIRQQIANNFVDISLMCTKV